MKNHRQTHGESAEAGTPQNVGGGNMPPEFTTPDADAFCQQKCKAETPPSLLEAALDKGIYAVELLETLKDNPQMSNSNRDDYLKCIIKIVTELNILFAKTNDLPYRTND